jgi:hypothetical protein
MKMPCEDCICLARCKARVETTEEPFSHSLSNGYIRIILTLVPICSLIENYLVDNQTMGRREVLRFYYPNLEDDFTYPFMKVK